MDPTTEELAGLDNLAAVLQWVGLENRGNRATKDGLWTALGQPTLVRHLAAVPFQAWQDAVAAWTVPVTEGEVTAQEAPTPVEQGQAGILRRVVRLLMGLDPAEGTFPLPPLPVFGSIAGTQSDAQARVTTATPQTRKVKMSAVMDQADDTEVRPLEAEDLRKLVLEWRDLENDGEDPLEEEEATGDQLAALSFRLRDGGTPFVDFAVWRPFGARFGRLLKFQAYFPLASGGFQTKEINGPGSYEEWHKSWRVFAWAMSVLKAASRFRLQRYELRIAKLNETYQGMWWIVAMADIRMRSEHMERIRRNLERTAAQRAPGVRPLQGEFDAQRPWDMVFREAARDEAFWQEQVDRKALLFAAHVKSPGQLLDDGVGAVVAGSEALLKAADSHPKKKKRKASESVSTSPDKPKKVKKKKTKTKRQQPGAPPGGKGGKGGAKSSDTKQSDGRFFRDERGKQICWTWNHSADGCHNPCSSGRAHVCEWCRGNHRSINCSKKPDGWTP